GLLQIVFELLRLFAGRGLLPGIDDGSRMLLIRTHHGQTLSQTLAFRFSALPSRSYFPNLFLKLACARRPVFAIMRLTLSLGNRDVRRRLRSAENINHGGCLQVF